MYLKVDLKGATHLVVNMNSSSIEYSNQLCEMFESNTTAVKEDYSELKTVEVESTIHLGSVANFAKNSYGEEPIELVVVTDPTKVSNLKDFEKLTNEVLISNKKLVDSLKLKMEVLKKENSYLKDTISRLESKAEENEETE